MFLSSPSDQNFREVLLKGRLAAALRKLNLRDGQAVVG